MKAKFNIYNHLSEFSVVLMASFFGKNFFLFLSVIQVPFRKRRKYSNQRSSQWFLIGDKIKLVFFYFNVLLIIFMTCMLIGFEKHKTLFLTLLFSCYWLPSLINEWSHVTLLAFKNAQPNFSYF